MKLKNRIYSLFLAAFIVAFSFAAINVQAVTVDRQYIGNNRSYRALKPRGLVIHSTANPGATAQNNRDYFNRVYVASSAHYFVDWNKTIQTIPEIEQAWHAGPYANHRYLSIEMCEPRNNQAQFNKVYRNTVELAADMCKRYGWSASNIVSHSYISNTYHQTDHEDPIAFLRKYGKSWNTLINDIQKAISGQNAIVNKPTASVNNSVRDKKARIVNIQSYLNVRYEPKGKIIGKLHNGDTIKLWRLEGDWYHIYSPIAGYKQAYIHKDYVKVINNASTSTTTNNNWISILQAECNRQGFSNQKIDGIMGKNTLNGCPTLRQGARGNITKLLQKKLGVQVDGIFGRNTYNAVVRLQKSNGLVADGIVGRNTWKVILKK